jgi:catechol 2,3-dioxygenase-like lactoylglutathione lyase family enzyme
MYAFTSPDHHRLAAFWAELMGLPLTSAAPEDPEATVFLDFDHEVSAHTWLFQHGDPGPPSDRLGLDIATQHEHDWRDPADRAEALGATRGAERELQGARWIELSDPDGNPFRVFAPRPV